MSQRKKMFILWGTLITLTTFLGWAIYTPIPFTLLKIGTLASVSLLLVTLGIGFKHGKWMCLSALLLLLAVACWPTPGVKNNDLQKQYLASLKAYEGIHYVWGGENARGIDCSGLIRRAMIDALLAEGWKQKNPAHWREAALIWWCDCSANEMKKGYSGRIETQFAARSLNTLARQKPTDLRPGDLAVLQSGVHVLAFLGDKTWIQADPNLANGGDKVIQTKAPSKNGWFGQRVVICRWKSLAEELAAK